MDKQFAGWKDKMKQKLEDVKKKMDEGEDEVAPPKQTESQPTPPRKALKFSINTMNEFSHEELQSVILKYDSELYNNFIRCRQSLLYHDALRASKYPPGQK